MNTIILRRVNIGQDSVVKQIEGQNVVEFTVADNRKYKDSSGEHKEVTTWYRCSYWTSHVAIAEFLKKGSTVNVVGKLTASAYLNKSNQPQSDLKVTVNEIDLLDRKEKEQENRDLPDYEPHIKPEPEKSQEID